ncbi:hypothetical protein AWC38_SpisGene2876 [Stylophora pistillata]|uniref:SAM domain-containing protein n=1 Tax=Stylophora pistillata TaxID=50429 RepID=A0A2B4ST66_STYPI|nr:hypothetical protein AWC38_SpisGene2876 [Stylophora pistillata]
MSDHQPVSLSPSSYPLKDFVVKFELPQPVTVQDGYFDEYQSESIGAGAVCNLLSLESVETGIFEDEDGEDIHIPLDDPFEVERVAEARFEQHLTLEDLIDESSTVKFVRVVETDPNFESIIRRGDKLKIKRKKSRETFLAFKKVSDKGKPLMKVPASCLAKFLPLLDGEELPLNKFVRKYKLPIFVVMNFIDYSRDKNSNKDEEIPREKPTTRIVKSRRQLSNSVLRLKGILADFIVLASMEVDGVPLKLSFPKTIPINVVPLNTESTTGAPESTLEFVSSERNETGKDSSELIAVEETAYVDMSGLRDPQGSSQSKMSVRFENNIKCGDETMKITQLAGLAARNNTYSPAPSKKVSRSQSVKMPRQGNGTFSRSVSDLELASEDNVYEELQFHTLPHKMKKHPSLLRRRRSDWSIERVSKQNLNNLLHLPAQSSEDHGFRSHVEVVSLQIPKLSPTYKKCPMMKTFGRKEKINETENSPNDVQGLNLDSYTSQSLDLNRLRTKLTSVTSKAPFYESQEMECDAPFNPDLSNQSEGKRESGDALPSLPSSQRSCGDRFHFSSRDLLLKEKADPKGRHNVIDSKIPFVGTSLKKTIPPEPLEEEDFYENVKLQTKSIVSSTSVREAVTNKNKVSVGVSSVGTTKNDCRTGPLERRDQCSIRERQPKSPVSQTGLQEPVNIEKEEEEPPPIPARLKHTEEPLYSLVCTKRNPSQDKVSENTTHSSHTEEPLYSLVCTKRNPSQDKVSENTTHSSYTEEPLYSLVSTKKNPQQDKISENTTYSSHLHSNPLLKGRPQPSPRRPRGGSNLSPSDLIKARGNSSVHSDSVPPSLEMKPMTAVRDDPNSNFAIPQDLSTLSVTDVLKCLNALNMKKFEDIFSERQVDGNMLVCLDEEALESIGMDRFHRLKLLKFIAGHIQKPVMRHIYIKVF